MFLLYLLIASVPGRTTRCASARRDVQSLSTSFQLETSFKSEASAYWNSDDAPENWDGNVWSCGQRKMVNLKNDLKSKPGRVSLLSLVSTKGTYAPMTLGHAETFKTAMTAICDRKKNLMTTISDWKQISFMPSADYLLFRLAFNGDDRMAEKFIDKPEAKPYGPELKHRQEVARLTLAHERIRYVKVESSDAGASSHDWIAGMESKIKETLGPEASAVDIIQYEANGADDVYKYSKWRKAAPDKPLVIVGRVPNPSKPPEDGGAGTPDVVAAIASYSAEPWFRYLILTKDCQDTSSSALRKALKDGDTTEVKRMIAPGALKYLNKNAVGGDQGYGSSKIKNMLESFHGHKKKVQLRFTVPSPPHGSRSRGRKTHAGNRTHGTRTHGSQLHGSRKAGFGAFGRKRRRR